MRLAAATIAAGALLFAACSREQPPSAPAPEPAPVVEAEPELDPLSGLKMTGDWQTVRAACTACHSAKLITGQRGTAEQWLAMIRWMQKKQNLWQFDAITEGKIIAYLADNYPPSAAQRRMELPSELMPPNPYEP